MWRLPQEKNELIPQEKNELKVHTTLSSARASFPAHHGDGRCPGKWLGGLLPLEAKRTSSMKAKTGDKSPFATLPQAAPWYRKPPLREGHLLFLTVLKISLNCTRVLWTNHEWRVLLTFGESWKHRHVVRPRVRLGLGWGLLDDYTCCYRQGLYQCYSIRSSHSTEA